MERRGLRVRRIALSRSGLLRGIVVPIICLSSTCCWWAPPKDVTVKPSAFSLPCNLSVIYLGMTEGELRSTRPQIRPESSAPDGYAAFVEDYSCDEWGITGVLYLLQA